LIFLRKLIFILKNFVLKILFLKASMVLNALRLEVRQPVLDVVAM
jgi:hypothetical protein